MKKDRMITWFICHNDSHTNKVISSRIPNENMHEEKCSDGITRDLWECDFSFIKEMRNSKIDLGLDFRVFKKEGKYGPIKPFDFNLFNSERKKKKIDLKLVNKVKH